MSGGIYNNRLYSKIANPNYGRKRAHDVFVMSLTSRGVPRDTAEKVWKAEQLNPDVMTSTAQLSGRQYDIDGQPYSVPFRRYETASSTGSRSDVMVTYKRIADNLYAVARDLAPFMIAVKRLQQLPTVAGPTIEQLPEPSMAALSTVPRPTS